MDAIDILGSLLGHKKSRPGKGSDVLKDVLGGGSRKTSPGPGSGPADINQQAKELEDLLNVSNQRQSHRPPGAAADSATLKFASERGIPASRPAPSRREPTPANSENEKALILVRAMVNAAKSDGQIDQAEQQSIIEHLHSPSPDAIQFLRDEFRKPLDVREFATSVPIGMEQQVYTMSLIAIDLDTSGEAKYLMALAEGLRLPMEIREQIHQRLAHLASTSEASTT